LAVLARKERIPGRLPPADCNGNTEKSQLHRQQLKEIELSQIEGHLKIARTSMAGTECRYIDDT
jgi:hypothetical protein